MLHMQRECACTFMCLNRPTATVTYMGTNGMKYALSPGTVLGQVSVPFELCDRNILVSRAMPDGSFKPRYEIVGNCCQLGFFCKAPCESCQSIDFHIQVPRSSGDQFAG